MYIILLIIILILAIYVIASFLFSKNTNEFLNKLLKETLWIWLPFLALWKLTKDLIAKLEEKK